MSASVDVRELRERVLDSLRSQGFVVEGGRIVPPDALDKDALRGLHARAVEYRRECARKTMERHEDMLLSYIADGREVDPRAVKPRLVLVRPKSVETLLFRYAQLHWSIPVSSGYGRRLRFVVFDEANGKLIGIFGLMDPVYHLGVRDRWIGWNSAAKRKRLQHVMDLFTVGAVPPYSHLLGGKLLALLSTSAKVQRIFRRRYEGARSIIRSRALSGELALLTTSSALGRSSIYNRISFGGRPLFISVGYTRGHGDFHFATELYEDLRRLVEEQHPSAQQRSAWGVGYRNRRRLVTLALSLLGLPRSLLRHGVEREFFVVPLARNTRKFLCGRHHALRLREHTSRELSAYFRERWLLPRAAWDKSYRAFRREDYRLW